MCGRCTNSVVEDVSDALNKRPGRAATVAHHNCRVLTFLTLLILLTICAGVSWDTQGMMLSGGR